MVAVEEVVQKIEQQAETSSQEVRNIKSLKVGQGVRQGDVYLVRVSGETTLGEREKSNQLVSGTNAGSRHVAEKPAQIFRSTARPTGISETAILGPVVKSEGRFSVTHPEHAHFSLPAGTYQCVQQLDERTKNAVVD